MAFQAKPDFKIKELFWTNEVMRDSVAYERLRRSIYYGTSLPIVFKEVWLGGLLIWLGGTALPGLKTFGGMICEPPSARVWRSLAMRH